jgi:hypothetical protein
MHQSDALFTNNVINELNEEDKKFLKEHIETKRVTINHKGIKTNVARRIIKVKKRTNNSAFGSAAQDF